MSCWSVSLKLTCISLFQILAAPFAAGALFLKPPWAFISLIPSNVIGEMWVGVTLTIVVELVPSTIRTPSIAYYLFVISIIGGNMPLLVPQLKKVYGLRTALYILFPGLYVLSSVLFLLTVFALKRDLLRAKIQDDVIKPLLPETPTSETQPKLVWQLPRHAWGLVWQIICTVSHKAYEDLILIGGMTSTLCTGGSPHQRVIHNILVKDNAVRLK